MSTTISSSSEFNCRTLSEADVVERHSIFASNFFHPIYILDAFFGCFWIANDVKLTALMQFYDCISSEDLVDGVLIPAIQLVGNSFHAAFLTVDRYAQSISFPSSVDFCRQGVRSF